MPIVFDDPQQAVTSTAPQKKRGIVFDEPPPEPQKPDYSYDSALPNLAQTQQQITNRPNLLEDAKRALGEWAISQVQHPLQTNIDRAKSPIPGLPQMSEVKAAIPAAGAAGQIIESAIANPALEAQKGNFSGMGDAFLKGFTGEERAQLGDLIRTGSPELQKAFATGLGPIGQALPKEQLAQVYGLAVMSGMDALAAKLLPMLGRGAAAAGETIGEGVSAIKRPVSQFMREQSGRPTSLRAELPESILKKMSATDRNEYYALQKNRVSRQANRQMSGLIPENADLSSAENARALDLQSEAMSKEAKLKQREIAKKQDFELDRLDKQKKSLELEMAKSGHAGVLKLRNKWKEVARAYSKKYGSLIDAALEANPSATFSREEVLQALERAYPENPERVQATFQQIFPYESGQPWTNASARDVIKGIKKLSGDISTSSKKGSRSYTYAEKLADDAKHELINVLEEKGVNGFTDANKMWKDWAPTRNEVMKDFKPHLTDKTETLQGANLLIKSAADPKDIGNIEYINKLENILGEDLTGDLKKMASQLDETQKAKAAVNIKAQLQRQAIEDESMRASSQLSEKKYQVQREGIQAKKAIEDQRSAIQGSRDQKLKTLDARKHAMEVIDARRKIIRDIIVAVAVGSGAGIGVTRLGGSIADRIGHSGY